MTRIRQSGSRWLVWTSAAMAMLALGLFGTFDADAQDEPPVEAKKADTSKKSSKVDAKSKKSTTSKSDGEDQDSRKNVKVVVPKRVDQLLPEKGGVDTIVLIDELIAKGWVDNKIQPADRCSDYTFVRRAHLDLIGRIPTPEEIRKFFGDPAPKRRAILVERLMGEHGTAAEKARYTHEFGENMANIWTVMLLTRSGSQATYQEQLREWLEQEFTGPPKRSDSVKSLDVELKDDEKPTKLATEERESPDWSKTATRLISANGTTNRNPAVNFLLHHLGDEIKENRSENGAWDMVPVTSRITRLFLGIRTQCVQCHDHPFNGEWTQKHFWQVNAFLRQTAPSGRPMMMAAKKAKGKVGVQNYTLRDDPSNNSDGIVSYERRNGLVLYASPVFLDGQKMPKLDSNRTRRDELAKFVASSPYFGRAFVNRMWGHFFGKSFTKDSMDDFGEHNPVSHPELLDKLGEVWSQKYAHNPKMLFRWICNSQAYGLDSKANRTNDKAEDEVFFGRMLLKPMSPEQLFDSLMTATQAGFAANKEERKAKREDWLKTLVTNFGNDEGEEGNFNGTVVQALLLMNGKDINSAITDQNQGTVAMVLKKKRFSANTAREAIRDLYLAALSREPSDAEIGRLLSPKTFAMNPRNANSPVSNPTTSQFWIAYYQDIFWGLVNSNEFMLNH